MMQALTLQQIAEALGKTKSTVLRRAAKEDWAYETVKARGGEQRQYPLATLPADVAAVLQPTIAPADVPPVPAKPASKPDAGNRRLKKEDGLKRFAALPQENTRRLRAKARELVLQVLWEFRRQGLAWQAAFEECAHQVNQGEMALPQWAWQWMPQRHGRRALTAATLKRWHYDYESQGIWGLVDGYGNRKAAFKVAEDPELKKIVIGCLMQAPHIPPRDIRAYLEARHPDLADVSEKAIERFIKHWKSENAQLWAHHTNPDAWKNKFMAAHGSHHESVTRLNQLWELDSTPADWMLADGRHSVVGVIDMFTRRLRFLVSKTSTAEAVGLVFRRCVMEWGVPEAIRTDNGKDYVSQRFTTVVRNLEVEHRLCVPFASEQKGTIERAMRTMSHGILDLLPGFIGHNVAERKVIEARKSFADRIMKRGEEVDLKMSAADLQQRLDQWCDHVYLHNRHGGLDCTPFERLQQCRTPVRQVSDERALDALLMELAGIRTVTKQGLKLDHYHYTDPKLAVVTGEQVHLRRDPSDLGRVYVYSLDGEFICMAVAHELLGISRAEAAAAAHQHQKRFLAQQKEAHRESQRAVRENIAEVVLEQRIEQSDKLLAFPRPSESYSTAALQQAGLAARAADPIAASPLSDNQQEALEELRSEGPLSMRPVARIDDPRRDYERWMRLDQRAQRGDVLNNADAKFHRHYPTTSEYRNMKSFFEDFGDPLLGTGD